MDNATRDKILYALNAQHVLLQQKVLTEIQKAQVKSQDWVFEGAEYPVSARNGLQTRIGLVFSHRNAPGFHLGIECVQPRLDYEAWAFFGTESMIRKRIQPRLFLEIFDRKPSKQKAGSSRYRSDHRIEPWCDRHPFRVFNYYVEAKMEGFGRRRGRADTIEEVFARAIAGQTGLLQKLTAFGKRSRICVLPVVVTTAGLFGVDFDPANVSSEGGTITRDEVSMEELPYLAVNYHPNDDLSIPDPEHTYGRETIEDDLSFWQVRSVFVVQALHINEFLHRLGTCLKLDATHSAGSTR